MSTLTIRNRDPAIKDRLRPRAARNGRSMEAETRAILTEAVVAPVPLLKANLYDQVRARIEPVGGGDLDLPSRLPMREPPTFGRCIPRYQCAVGRD
jgi:plasmid stability protein